MLKRNGKVATRDDQLSLFDFARSREQTNLSDPIRTDCRTPLAGVPAEDGSGTGGEGRLDGSTLRGAGENIRRNGSSHPAARNGAEADAATGHDRAWEMIREKYILLPPEENLAKRAQLPHPT